MTWKQQNFPNSAPLTENYPYQSRGVPKASTLHTLTFKLHHLSQATDQMGAEYNQLVREKLGSRRLSRELKQAAFLSLGRKPEENILHAKIVVFPRFLN